MNKELESVIKALSELEADLTVPKNIRAKIHSIIQALQTEEELSIKINKVLHELDEISNDTNMQPYTRTQIWNVVSILEKL